MSQQRIELPADIEALFDFYLDKTHSYKGIHPDTLEEFIGECIKDPSFLGQWIIRYDIEQRL